MEKGSPQTSAVEAPPRGVRPAVWALGALLVPPTVFWMLKMEMLSGGATRGGGSALGGASYPTAMSLFFHVVFLLALLSLSRRLLPPTSRCRFTSAELATLYSMLSVGTAVAGVDMIQVLVPMAAYPVWFASAENDWQNLFVRYLPAWWVVHDRGALERFYGGEGTLYSPRHLGVWLPVVGWWLAFLCALLAVFGGLTALLRRQWVEHERLAYPVIQLPMALIEEPGVLGRSRFFAVGFGAATALSAYNGLAYLYPVLPLMVWSTNLNDLLREHPWRAIGFTPVRLYPFVVALVFLIPKELSFSGWFFYWLAKGLRVVGASAGWRGLPEFPYSRQQSFGAYLAIFAFAVYAGRRHFAGLVRQAVMSRRPAPGEPIPYRVAAVVVLVGAAFLILATLRAGMSLWVAASFFLLYGMLSVGLTRVRAELGAPVHDLHFMGPERILTLAAGTRALGARNLALLSMFYWFNRAYRCHPMPHQLEALKLAQHERAQARTMVGALIAAGVVGGLSVWWLLLHAFYREGGLSGIASYAVSAFGREPFARLERWMAYPAAPDVPAAAAIGLGFAATVGMLGLRARYVWWSLHPLGYALADDYAMNWIWSSVLLGWGLKALVLRAGGIRAYRGALPLVFGVILGEFSAGSMWSLVSLLSGRPMYAFKNW
jgi:hypothetical protein